jgi:hypothetical protein
MSGGVRGGGATPPPTRLNVVLHGMEEAAGVRYHPDGHRDAGTAVPGSPVLIRYADDALALCHSREQAEQVRARLAAWLEPRGLAFNPKLRPVGRVISGLAWCLPSGAGWRSGYVKVSGMGMPIRSKAWRWALVGSVSIGMAAWVPANRTWLRVKVAR